MQIKLFSILSLDVAFVLTVAALLSLGTAPYAYAYVDPSVMTYTIQALAGVAVALSAVLGVAWRRCRKTLMKVLRIDENSNKAVDPPVERVGVQNPIFNQKNREAEKWVLSLEGKKAQCEDANEIPWKRRFALSLATALLLVFTFLFATPLEIVAGNQDSLLFGVSNVIAPLAIASLLGTIVIALLLSCLRGKWFSIFHALIASLGIGSCLQAFFLNGGLPQADGSAIAWENYTTIMLVSALVWTGIIVACIMLARKQRQVYFASSICAAIVLVLAQSIGVIALVQQPQPDGSSAFDEKSYITSEGLMDISSQSNVIMFVLDTFDQSYLDETLAAYPDALDDFSGFTRYTNTVGSMIPTRYAMASLINGKTLTTADEAFSNSLLRRWYSEKGLLDSIADCGYSIGIYASDLQQGMTALSHKTINIHPIANTNGNPILIVGELGKSAAYLNLPWLFKPFFVFYTGDLDKAVLGSDEAETSESLYVLDDATLYQRIQTQGLTFSSEENSGSFKLIHLFGAHGPYTLSEDALSVPTGTSKLEQCRGSLRVVSAYLQELKRIGVYDEATIIVTADHGYWYLTEDIQEATNPILLFKPSQSTSLNNQSCVTSNKEVGHSNLPATILEAMGDTSSAGASLTATSDEQQTRYYYASSVIVSDEVNYSDIIQWAIEGNASDFANWRKTGATWPIVSD